MPEPWARERLAPGARERESQKSYGAGEGKGPRKGSLVFANTLGCILLLVTGGGERAVEAGRYAWAGPCSVGQGREKNNGTRSRGSGGGNAGAAIAQRANEMTAVVNVARQGRDCYESSVGRLETLTLFLSSGCQCVKRDSASWHASIGTLMCTAII